MPLKMMRKNVLVKVGQLQNTLGAKLVELPDKYKLKPSRGFICDVGPKCVRFGDKDIGNEVVVGIEHDAERWISPTHSEQYGMSRDWHVIMHEDKIAYEIEHP